VQAPVSYSVGHIKPKLEEDQLVQPVHIVDIDDAKYSHLVGPKAVLQNVTPAAHCAEVQDPEQDPAVE
jgi:hypothetical protein